MIAKQMPFTTPDGAQHPQAFWRLVELHATTDGVRIVFYGYHDKAAHDAGASPMQGAVKDYSPPSALLADGGEFDALVTAIHGAAWQIALGTKDVGEIPADGEEDARVSFFAGAVDAS